MCREIEKNIDTVNNLRRDKYIIEGKLKKYVERMFSLVLVVELRGIFCGSFHILLIMSITIQLKKCNTLREFKPIITLHLMVSC